MFSLIISIIAIALAAVLLLTSAFYGGDALTEGSAKAEAAKLANEAQQISGAYDMHRVENGGTAPLDIAELVTDDYLKAAPITDWVISGTDLVTSDSADVDEAISDEVCGYVNATANGLTCAAGTNTNVVTFAL